jgi:hypothetical protein
MYLQKCSWGKMFPNLYEFLKNILSLPHGSAVPERVFSSLNLIKRKNRNCLDVSTCHNLLLTKEMMRDTTCCELYFLSPKSGGEKNLSPPFFQKNCPLRCRMKEGSFATYALIFLFILCIYFLIQFFLTRCPRTIIYR